MSESVNNSVTEDLNKYLGMQTKVNLKQQELPLARKGGEVWYFCDCTVTLFLSVLKKNYVFETSVIGSDVGVLQDCFMSNRKHQA